MSMNRETKRLLQRQGALTAEGAPTRAAPRQPKAKEDRASIPQFLREVRGELRKVAFHIHARLHLKKPNATSDNRLSQLIA